MATGNDVEVEADRKAAEDSGCAVTLKSNQLSLTDHLELSTEAPKQAEDDAARRRGRGQGWGRGRPRASRFRPPGHSSQGSQRENHAPESDLLEDKDSDRRLSPSYAGYDATSNKYSPSGDWATGPPSESSAFQSQSCPSNGGQKPRESGRGQRAMSGRGQSRGPFAKFVTVPDASHSHDVRHVEEVNNSIVINIDRSNRSGGDSMKRGGGRGTGGGGGGYRARSNSSGEMLEDGANVGDQEAGVLPSSENASPQKSGFRGQGQRPFRGRGDGSYRGRGEGSFWGQGQGRADGFRRGRGDGPRPFRGGYKADRARGGRNSRRAVIVTSKNEGGDSSQQIPDSEDGDKVVPAACSAGEEGTSDGHCWTSTEDCGAKWEESEDNQDPNRSEAFDSGHSYEESCKELDFCEGEKIARRNLPEEVQHATADQSECHSGGMDDHPKTSLASKDEPLSPRAENSPSSSKPSKTISELETEVAEGGSRTRAMETLKEKSSSNAEKNVESKPHKTSTVSKAADVDNPSSHSNDSRDSVAENVAEAESGQSLKKPSNLEVADAVDLSFNKNDSHDFMPEKALRADSNRSDCEMSLSKPLPSEAAAAEESTTSIQSKAPETIPLGESYSSEPAKSANNGLEKKSEAVTSEIPASVKEKK